MTKRKFVDLSTLALGGKSEFLADALFRIELLPLKLNHREGFTIYNDIYHFVSETYLDLVDISILLKVLFLIIPMTKKVISSECLTMIIRAQWILQNICLPSTLQILILHRHVSSSPYFHLTADHDI